MNTPGVGEGTVRISCHARHRCEEMGISTKVAKEIVRHPSVNRPGGPRGPENRILWSDRHPAYAVVYDPVSHLVITVLFQTTVDYVRDGATFLPKGAPAVEPGGSVVIGAPQPGAP